MRPSVIKYGSLALLTIQNSLLILTLRYSRSQPGPKYLTSTAVLISELLKALLSFTAFTIIRYRASRSGGWTPTGAEEAEPLLSQQTRLIPESKTVYQRLVNVIPLLVPAILYTLQNNLQLIAVSHLEAATFQVLYQGKILATAGCMVIFLGKRLSAQQCVAIVLLTIGISCASIPSDTANTLSSASEYEKQNHALGIATVGAACGLSGMAGVWIEMTLKKAQRQSDHPAKSFWQRNLQLSTMSVIFAIPGVLLLDRKQLLEHGFFQGYSNIVMAAILLQAVGGLAVALVVTHADNILKGFATSISVLVCAGISVLLHSPITPLFAVGMCCVVSASCLYATKEEGRKSTKVIGLKAEDKNGFLP